MGRNIKGKYPRTCTKQIRTSEEHKMLLDNIQKAILPFTASDADIIEWALEEFALKYCKKKIKFIPRTMPKLKAKIAVRGKTIIM